jgi:hypothetical protein
MQNLLTLRGKAGKSIMVNAIAKSLKTLVINTSNSKPIWEHLICHNSKDINELEMEFEGIKGYIKNQKVDLVVFYANCKEVDLEVYKKFAYELSMLVTHCIITVQE